MLLSPLSGMSYLPLIRKVLTLFVDCEPKALLRDKIAQELDEPEESPRKVA